MCIYIYIYVYMYVYTFISSNMYHNCITYFKWSQLYVWWILHIHKQYLYIPIIIPVYSLQELMRLYIYIITSQQYMRFVSILEWPSLLSLSIGFFWLESVKIPWDFFLGPFGISTQHHTWIWGFQLCKMVRYLLTTPILLVRSTINRWAEIQVVSSVPDAIFWWRSTDLWWINSLPVLSPGFQPSTGFLHPRHLQKDPEHVDFQKQMGSPFPKKTPIFS